MENSSKELQRHLYIYEIVILIHIGFLFLYDFYSGAWKIERKNMDIMEMLFGWGLLISFFAFFCVLWKTRIQYDNVFHENEINISFEKKIKKAKRRYRILGALVLVLIMIFFMYQTYFDLWSKSVNDLPFIFSQILFIYILLIFFIGHLFWRSAVRHSNLSNKKE